MRIVARKASRAETSLSSRGSHPDIFTLFLHGRKPGWGGIIISYR